MKKCLKCNSEKDLSEFNKDKRDKSGYNTQCRKCVNERRNKVDNIISVESKICLHCNLDKSYTLFKRQKDSKDGLFHMCKECFNIWRRNYREDEGVKLREIEERKGLKDYYNNYSKIWKENNKEKVKLYEDKSRNRPERKEYEKNYRREYSRNRRNIDTVYKLKGNLRSYIRLSFANKGLRKNSKTSQILGCSFEEFKLYLESKFETWMSLENYGKYNGELNYGWDIDHIIPLSSVDKEEEVLYLNHFTNLQPLCSYTNRYIKKDSMNFEKSKYIIIWH